MLRSAPKERVSKHVVGTPPRDAAFEELRLEGQPAATMEWIAGPSPAEAMAGGSGHEASARVGGSSPAMTGTLEETEN
jgi:hypothetical protein